MSISSNYFRNYFYFPSAPIWFHNNLRGGLPPGAPLRPPQQLGGDQAGRPEVRLRDEEGRGGEVGCV